MEKPHKKLDVWQRSMDLTVDLYAQTDRFPKEERYGLTDQLRRAAVSVPSNIAEGAARQSRKEFAHFLRIAQGSVSELDTQIELARRLGFLGADGWSQVDEQLERIDKMLSGLIRRQRRGDTPQSPPASHLTPPG
jgi:four helix bundle protein